MSDVIHNCEEANSVDFMGGIVKKIGPWRSAKTRFVRSITTVFSDCGHLVHGYVHVQPLLLFYLLGFQKLELR